ncbi:hypothetical protein [Haliovirga abyssi]|uniref:Secretin/TonB short N-terminal domain-containing protein n=1 Tax=Haliovirga abyssi TaxID=2996794 RepID=A0AAU9DUT0_9FUSO|nr:hypothetical protein [Haliovirga abyssi]BDU49786.1 hypothetical protein HLVA_03550 [Haliovirga abyssi]
MKGKFKWILVLFIVLSAISFSAGKKIKLSVRGAEIKDVLIMLTQQSGINVVPDRTVTGRVTINLENVNIAEAFKVLNKVYGYKFDKIGDNTYMVTKKNINAGKKEIKIKHGLISFNIQNSDIREVLNDISQKSGINIIMEGSVNGKISGSVKDVDIEDGLTALLQANGFSLMKDNNIYRVLNRRSINSRKNKMNISIVNNKISIDVENESIVKILREIGRLSNLNMIIVGGGVETINVKLHDISVQDSIETILSGTSYTYSQNEDGTYIIGRKNIGSASYAMFTRTELIPLQYVHAEKIPTMLPNNFPVSNIKVISEQNAILATGTDKELKRLKGYLKELDKKAPQISVEALVIEISHNNNNSSKLELQGFYGDEKNILANSSTGDFRYLSLTKVSNQFYSEIKLLVQKGEARIKASPSITTLNGEKATINVGTVQYYKVTTLDENGKEKNDYKSVDAGVSLNVTPWITSSGEINLKINPTISNIGASPAEGPPSVSKREANTVVRIKDGGTIVIGGLTQNVVSNKVSGVPFISDIPLLGELFKSRTKDLNQIELIIYITPKILKNASEREAKNSMKEMIKKVENK